MRIHIIGGGLAGSEAAWQAAAMGVPVTLYEMRPIRPTAVHKTDRLAELVCSNSFRGDKLDNAVGLLKEEMRRLGSLIMRAADARPGACRSGPRGRSRTLLRGGDARDCLASGDHHRPARGAAHSRGARWSVDHCHRTADFGLVVAADRRDGRREPPVFLRRDQPDRPRRIASIERRYFARRGGGGISGFCGVRRGSTGFCGVRRGAAGFGSCVRRGRWRG